jgi:invasion protein IalB
MKTGILVVGVAVLAVSFGAVAEAQQRQAPSRQQPAATAQPQATPKPEPSAPAAQVEPAPTAGNVAGTQTTASGWSTRCTSVSRQGSQECAIEQSVLLTRTGQTMVRVSIRVPGDTRTPSMLVQLPLGLFLPVGAKFQVDEGKPLDVQVQTCEAQGCLAGSAVDAELLAAIKAGKQLTIGVQTLNKEKLSFAMPLEGFTAAYERVQ